MQAIFDKAKPIKLLLLDVDGVLTDGKIYFTEQGLELKAFNSQDGIGIKLLQKNGVEVGVITGRKSTMVEKRMSELGVTHIYQGQDDKLETYKNIKTKHKLENHHIAMMGDDLPDLSPMQEAGLSITVPNACDAVKKHADWQTNRHGGFGAVREACELILKAQGNWEHSS